MLTASVIVCDRKRYSLNQCLRALAVSKEIDCVYLNIETGTPDLYAEAILDFEIASEGKPLDVDYWNISKSTWRVPQRYDQHQVRLLPIVTARNMAIDYALVKNATSLLFVDSDVMIDPDNLHHLVGLNKNLRGGFVPGRGAHGHVNYVFGAVRGTNDHGATIECDHGTCGYMLINRVVFTQLRFRWGMDRLHPDQMLSEDPAFCFDWYDLSGERFWIHKLATAQHIDNAASPLTQEGVAQDTWSEVKGDNND